MKAIDCLVLGAGLGGTFGTRQGKRVLVLEQHISTLVERVEVGAIPSERSRKARIAETFGITAAADGHH